MMHGHIFDAPVTRRRFLCLSAMSGIALSAGVAPTVLANAIEQAADDMVYSWTACVSTAGTAARFAPTRKTDA